MIFVFFIIINLNLVYANTFINKTSSEIVFKKNYIMETRLTNLDIEMEAGVVAIILIWAADSRSSLLWNGSIYNVAAHFAHISPQIKCGFSLIVFVTYFYCMFYTRFEDN